MKKKEEIISMAVEVAKQPQKKTYQFMNQLLKKLRLNQLQSKNAKTANFYWQFLSVLTVTSPKS